MNSGSYFVTLSEEIPNLEEGIWENILDKEGPDMEGKCGERG